MRQCVLELERSGSLLRLVLLRGMELVNWRKRLRLERDGMRRLVCVGSHALGKNCMELLRRNFLKVQMMHEVWPFVETVVGTPLALKAWRMYAQDFVHEVLGL